MEKIKQGKTRTAKSAAIGKNFSLASTIVSSVEKALKDEGMPPSKIRDIERKIVSNVMKADKSNKRYYSDGPDSLFALLRTFEEGSIEEMGKPDRLSIELETPLTTQQLAQKLRLSRTHVIHLLESGEIPFYLTSGGHRRITAEAANVYAEALKTRKIENLKKIALASEEAGLYELD